MHSNFTTKLLYLN